MHDRLGLLAFWKGYDRKLYVRAAELADELGYDSFWIPETWGYDAFSLLTEMACKTKRIKLGTGIVNVFSRSPGLLAMSAATLAEISDGRFLLGIGASGRRVIEGFHGERFEKPLTHVRDVIRVVRTLLGGGRLDQSGAKLAEYRPFELATQGGPFTVPIYVAALQHDSIASIGEMADGWMPIFWPYDRLDVGLAFIAEGARKVGRDPASIAVAPFTTVLPLGKEMGEAKARELIAFYVGGMGEYYKELLVGFGFAESCARIEELYRDKATRHLAREAVSPEMVRSLVLTGDPAECREELARRRSFGIDLPILNLPSGVPWEMVEAFIRAMAPLS